MNCRIMKEDKDRKGEEGIRKVEEEGRRKEEL